MRDYALDRPSGPTQGWIEISDDLISSVIQKLANKKCGVLHFEIGSASGTKLRMEALQDRCLKN